MASKLIDIPNHQLDSLLNEYIKKSDKITIIVSFVFESGLNLIFKSLKEFSPKHNLRIITSNYLKSTEPKALRKLLELQAMGAKVLLFDSLGSKQNFHIKSYCFANSSDLFLKSIVGSSNLSFGAFKGSFEFNVETEDEAFAEDLDRRVVEILSHSATLELSEGLIEESREANGKKRLYIPDEVRAMVVKSVKVKVKGQKGVKKGQKLEK